MPALSVIIPVYNKGDYLADCLRSIQAQTLRDFEIVCVNNNSTDCSMNVVRKFAEHDPRIIVAEEKIPGAAAARNKGLDLARGQFVTFVDADDYIDNTLFETYARKLNESDADVCIIGIDHFFPEIQTYLYPTKPGFTGPKTAEELDGNLFFVTTPSVCTKAFRRDSIERLGLRFNTQLKTAEDMLFSFTMLMKARSVYFVDEILYHYRQHVAGSLTHQTVRRGAQAFDSLKMLKQVAETSPAFDSLYAGLLNFSLEQARYIMQISCDADEFIEQYDAYMQTWWPQVKRNEVHIRPEQRYMFERFDKAQSAIELMHENWQDIVNTLNWYEQRCAQLEHQRSAETQERDDLKRRIGELEESTSYKVGKAIMAIPCTLKDKLRGLRG